MNKIKQFWNDYQQQALVGIMDFLFLAAAVQYALGLTYVMRLIAIFLAVIAATIIIVWEAAPRIKAALVAFIFVTGYIIELIGVRTGLLFGNYSYGSILGYRLWGVPIIIGVAWFIVTLSAWHIVQYGKLQTIQKFLLAGVLVVMFDLILEQFAVSYGLWAWRGGSIPLYNYICWFAISQVYFGLYNYFIKKFVPSIFIACILPIMAGFFWLMLLW